MQHLLWSIGSPDGRSPDLLDNYKEPNRPGDVVWRVSPTGNDTPQLWPLFHPSEADPDAGYRLHPYAIDFDLPDEPSGTYLLRIDYLAIAPRLADLDVEINGEVGHAYLRPHPSLSGEIRLHSGLHTSIYSEGTIEVSVPPHLLRRGENRAVLTARDRGEVLRAKGAEHILRLDRMANASGVIYQYIAFSHETCPLEGVLRAAELVPSVVYCRDGNGRLLERCHLYLDLTRGTAGENLTLEIGGHGASRYDIHVPRLPFGSFGTVVDVADGEGPITYRLEGELDGEIVSVSGEAPRSRKWKVFVAPHAHTDIGYTHRQWEVAERLCINIDRALAMVAEDRRSSLTYHLDSSWALESYLQTRDEEQRARLFDAIRAGKIGVAAGYVDLLTHFAALEDLIRNAAVTDTMLRAGGVQTDFAAVVDVASLSGALPALLQGAGVPYLVHANNQDRGPFRLLSGLHKRSPYYWEGTQGGRVLVWLSKMYCELRKVCGSPPVPDSAERGLQLWLDEYERPDYAPDAVLLYGQEADNTDLDPQPASFVERWNEMYAYPQLIPSTVGDFFHYVEERFGDAFPVVRGDGGAYWEDGAGSHIRSSATVRGAQASLPCAETLESLAVLHTRGRAYPMEQFDEAWRQVLLFDEHTWGSALSVADPEALIARDQWSVKEGMARDAAAWAQRLLHAAAVRHSLSWNTEGREIVVYNPHSWTVSGPATAEIHRDEVVVDGEDEREVPVRRLRTTRTQREVELWLDEIPGLSYRRFPLRPGRVGTAACDEETVLETDRYRLAIDPERGCLKGWTDKALGRQLVSDDPWGFGQLLYARGGEGTRLISNQADLPPGNPEILAQFELTGYRRTREAHATAASLSGRVPAGTLDVTWTVYDAAPYVDVEYVYMKEEHLAKEAVYVAFPIALPGARVLSDGQLGWVDWARDSLPGACKEWLPLQTGVLLAGEGADVLIASPDIPLFCVGDVVRGTWPSEKDLSGGRVLSYVLNNYWHTNYKASQAGEMRFRYRLASDRHIQPDRAYRAGWEARRPLYGHRISFQDFRDTRPPYEHPGGGTLASIESESVVLTTMKGARGQDGFILRLHEIKGSAATARIMLPGFSIVRAWDCDLLEHDLAPLPVGPDGSLAVEVSPHGLTTVRIVTGHP